MLRILIYCSLLLLFSCKKDDNSQINEIVIIHSDTQFDSNQSEGFSLAECSIIKYPNTEQILPDFHLDISESRGNPVAYFSSLVSKPTFVLIDSLPSADSAKIAFEKFSDINYYFRYYQTLKGVAQNQLWLVKSINNFYFKILIVDVVMVLNPQYGVISGQSKYIGNVTFKWKNL